jgi:hypothetical protein
MMAFEVDLKAYNRWDLIMHFKLKDPPSSLWWRYVPAINPPSNLIPLVFQQCTIGAFVDILEGVLDTSNGDSTFGVHVAVKKSTEPGRVRHNPPIIQPMISDLIFPSIVGPEIKRVAIAIHACELLVVFGITLAAFPIHHAGCIRIQCSTRPMNHALLDCFE